MKLATFVHEGARHVGRVDTEAGTVTPFELAAELAAEGLQHLIEMDARGDVRPPVGEPIPLDAVRLEAPLPRPRRNLFCVGKNYHDHAHEFAGSGFDSSAAEGAVPAFPIVFSKVPESVTGPDMPIELDPSVSSAIDYEVELAVIIGRGGRGITAGDALDHVWGYTIVNDVTARDLQGRHSQWLIAKSQDTFCPMGPWAVTRDALDLGDTRVRAWVDDELRQDSNTGRLIFDVPTIIETIAAGVTLLPGDVIATGTPAGVGIGFDPPRYLGDGARVRLEIDGIGTLRNTVSRRG